ncbi:MAG: phosphate ABC transporter substrate-binding protein [Lachnospiraceae bacterium]
MKKRLLGLTAVLALTLGCMTACGGEKTTETTDTTANTPAATTTAEAPAAAGTEETEEAATVEPGTVATDGSTSMEKVIGALGESFQMKYEGMVFTYNPTGSGSGITAAAEGTCDIGLSSRYLKDEEKELGLQETVLAIDGIAVVVNPANGVDDLTMQQIADIYTGTITNWSEVGGADAEIVVIGREAGSGTRDGFESITGTKDACVLRQELTSTGDVIATVGSNENAIGYASLASVNDNVTAIKVDGVAPSTETVLDGSYAIQRPFVLVTRTDTPLSASAQAFMDYALSEEANAVIEGAGVVVPAR